LVGCLTAAVSACVSGGLGPPGRNPRGDPSGNRALAEVRRLVSFSPRDAGTDGGARAAAHIASRLRALGLDTRVDEFVDGTPRGEMTFRNVLGRIPGRGRGSIIIGAHFDTKSGIEGFTGANDSGSGVGLLIELARILQDSPTGSAGILLAFFDGEECLREYGPGDGLHGSRRLARTLVAEGQVEAILGVVILDMVGDRRLGLSLPGNSDPELVEELLKLAGDQGDIALKIGPSMTDDHVPFLDRGIPAVDLIDFEYGSRPGANDYWHTAEDSLDKLSAESLAAVGRLVIRLVDRLQAP
jgi:glutaminyl-peptide cyclotransferase